MSGSILELLNFQKVFFEDSMSIDLGDGDLCTMEGKYQKYCESRLFINIASTTFLIVKLWRSGFVCCWQYADHEMFTHKRPTSFRKLQAIRVWWDGARTHFMRCHTPNKIPRATPTCCHKTATATPTIRSTCHATPCQRSNNLKTC